MPVWQWSRLTISWNKNNKAMKRAITGGIGAGKSYVCQCLKELGIDVFDCDASAKRLMRTSPTLQQALKKLVGEEVFKGVRREGEVRLNKPLLAKFLLESEEHQQAVNNLVHPAVAEDFLQSGKDWLESAIFFDSGFDQRIYIDKVVCVTAPLEVRIQRIMQRDGISREKALEWIHRQLPQEEVLRRSDYEIVNDGIADVREQVKAMLNAEFFESEVRKINCQIVNKS